MKLLNIRWKLWMIKFVDILNAYIVLKIKMTFPTTAIWLVKSFHEYIQTCYMNMKRNFALPHVMSSTLCVTHTQVWTNAHTHCLHMCNYILVP